MKRGPLTPERAREVLDYDPGTGDFRWRTKTCCKVVVGREAGSVNKTLGYRIITVDKHQYLAHRVAWVHLYGVWPPELVDHINGDKLDNRIANLRLANASLNQQNRKTADRDSTSRHLGVSWCSTRQRWTASIGLHGKSIRLGWFASELAAADAYQAAKSVVHHGAIR